MLRVEMYTTDTCIWCVRAKRLFAEKGIMDIEEINVSHDRFSMFERTQGRLSVPQIFINDKHIGGYQDLAALDRAGELDKLLQENEEQDNYG